ncbi:MAG TPA: carboxypeptidase-like regulatory domain-containing protein [Pyrinomonadaceae bacterium]|jgi:hypothetical protein
MKNLLSINFASLRRAAFILALTAIVFVLLSGLSLPIPFNSKSKLLSESFSFVTSVKAGNNYYDFSSGNLSLSLTPATTNMITGNDDWSAVTSVEGYAGTNLTNTHGVNPQTILGTEFANNALPSGKATQINANKGNPGAFSAGGLAEFDSGDYLSFGFQGSAQANPYMVFYLNTTGHNNITMSYQVTDIDAGSNNSVSQVALQYRVGTIGNFTNIPAGYIADATDPNVAGRVTSRSVLLPPPCNNQPQIQLRLITTNAAAPDGTNTPDEWIGVNNIVASAFAPTAATVTVGGRVISPYGRPLANATVAMYDQIGQTRVTRTNPFGFYHFDEVEVGETYIFEISSKKYVFTNAIRSVYVIEEINSLDFFADPIGSRDTNGEKPAPAINAFVSKF